MNQSLIKPSFFSNILELSLLLNSASLNFNTISQEQLQSLIQREINWERVFKMASYHGIFPLLNHGLTKVNPAFIPTQVLQQLQKYCRVNAIRNMGLAQELLRLLSIFNADGIQVIPYKGPTLGVMAYGDVLMRQFCDLDFLILKQDLIKVQELLTAENYQLRWEAMSKPQQDLYLQTSCEYTYISANQNFAVEPHWNILPKRFCIPINFQSLGQDLYTVTLLGHSVSTFSPETMLLIICLNGTKDRWQKLKLVCDVAGLIHQHPDLNWEELLKMTHKAGCTRILLIGLFLANTLLKTPLPANIWKVIRADTVMQEQAFEVIKNYNYFKLSGEKTFLGSNFSSWDLKIRERWRDKIWYCWNLLTTPNEGDANLVNLPPSLYCLYACLRPFRLVGRRIESLANRFSVIG